MIRVTIIAQGAEEEPELRDFMSGQISIGRLGRNDLVLVSSRVSSMHARALEGEHGILLVDNNSTNGTFVNGTQLRGSIALDPEDSVEIGSFTLHFERIPVAAEELMEDDSSLSEIAPSEFDELAAEEPGEFAEPDLLSIEATPADAFPAPRQFQPEAEPALDEDPPDTEFGSTQPGIEDVLLAAPRVSAREPAPPATGLAGAFERTVAALAALAAHERTEARAIIHARDAVELCCSDLDPRQRRQWSEWIAQEAVSLGPLTDLLADPTVAEVLVLGSTSIEVRRDSAREHHPTHFSCERAVAAAVERMIGVAPSEAQPIVDGVTVSNIAVHAVGRPLVNAGPIVSLSRPQLGPRSLAELLAQEQIDADAADTLAEAIRHGKNLLICGPPGLDSSGWVAAIAAESPTIARVVAVHRGRITRQLSERAIAIDGSRDMGAALRSGLRMRPDVLIVQELGGAEAVDLCASARRGRGSTIVSLVASSPEGALARLQAMVSLGVPRDPAALRGYVAGCFDMILALHDGATGRVIAGTLAEIRHAHASELVELHTHDD